MLIHPRIYRGRHTAVSSAERGTELNVGLTAPCEFCRSMGLRSSGMRVTGTRHSRPDGL